MAPCPSFAPDRHDIDGGFSLVEVVTVLAIIGALGVAAAPSLLSYWRTASVQAGAHELASVINHGRQLAISRKVAVCVDLTGTSIRLRVGGCAGPFWTGPVTDAAGVIRIADPALLDISANARVVFTPLGAASPSGTFTVTHAPSRTSRTVVVAASGRISLE